MTAHPVGWRREPARHALAARGIKTHTINPAWWSGRYAALAPGAPKWPQLTHEELNTFLAKAGPILEANRIYPMHGDCANFAVALSNILGGMYIASYTSEAHRDDAQPSHVALVLSDPPHNMFSPQFSYWDADGQTTPERVFNEARTDPLGHVEGQETVEEGVDIPEFVGIYDPKISRRIERILRGVLVEGKPN